MPLQERWLFDLRRAPSGSSLTIGGLAGCSATVLGAGSCPGFGARAARCSWTTTCVPAATASRGADRRSGRAGAATRPGSCPATGQGRSPPVRSSGRLLEPHKPAGGLRAQEPPPAQGGDGRSDATAIMPDRRSPLVSSVCHVLAPHRLPSLQVTPLGRLLEPHRVSAGHSGGVSRRERNPGQRSRSCLARRTASRRPSAPSLR
jgi:hypothetical protein